MNSEGNFDGAPCPPDLTGKNSIGRVVRAVREHFTVWTTEGEIEGSVAGYLRQHDSAWPAVGDWVNLRDGAMITGVLPRRTRLCRKEPGNAARAQVIAANVDVVFIVTGLDGDYNPRRLERYLVLVYESGARPVIVLNKADLAADRGEAIRQTELHAPGVRVLAVSALQQHGLEAVAAEMKPGQTAVLIGSSGVGKSTIVNYLLGEQRQSTTSVRESDSRGRHTTTRRELFLVDEAAHFSEPKIQDEAAHFSEPKIQKAGWWLIDTPGLREVHLWSDGEGVDQAFSEIREIAQSCKFRDCTHTSEPGCAVLQAALTADRLESYRKLQREVAYEARQADPHLARANRKKWNAVERAVRKHPKRTLT